MPGLLYGSVRCFSSTSLASKSACSIVKPVHHLVKIDKSKLTSRFPEMKYEKNDIRSPAFKPIAVAQDRGKEHYLNTLQPDLLLLNYSHGAKVEEGLKTRQWDGTSPYHINRKARLPRGSKAQLPNINVIDWKNIPQLDNIVLNCYVSEAKDNSLLAISAALQLQQITGVKPNAIYSKSDVPNWKLRKGRQMGAKVVLKGRPMYQFLSTLTEIVMPRIREYKGINESSGSRFGSVSLGLSSEDVKFFPEIDLNQDLWPATFGMHINFNTTAQNDLQAKSVISGFQVPFNNSPKEV
ncbi:hypothetical protein Kpol_1066p3 [Vanderwaltozyma polyspora DSM 70294]|uniref:Large ribosomal subunit protein uL5m n=1 Tax=Vanderwaltozyma polyspora (strain ATCC 22028 / DSM 70294 / BCRC 21397 / CBS 2163 / NBRC 10782 / NRRL Y-8283 / UCD 57-17) TaxID=436907 RepID=A7TMM5_VANPO|nr:uncharacterized protein Kpol_1066p3 [Vanderwaltozyma polyspora DSM 70294]EDO16439.1 hypothetical protein Kpol_1066p3 [Vanderwaltozyma polyspora DSM 70294]